MGLREEEEDGRNKIPNSNNKNTQKPLYLTNQKIENQNFCI